MARRSALLPIREETETNWELTYVRAFKSWNQPRLKQQVELVCEEL